MERLRKEKANNLFVVCLNLGLSVDAIACTRFLHIYVYVDV